MDYDDNEYVNEYPTEYVDNYDDEGGEEYHNDEGYDNEGENEGGGITFKEREQFSTIDPYYNKTLEQSKSGKFFNDISQYLNKSTNNDEVIKEIKKWCVNNLFEHPHIIYMNAEYTSYALLYAFNETITQKVDCYTLIRYSMYLSSKFKLKNI